jgi:hypothetical protein
MARPREGRTMYGIYETTGGTPLMCLDVPAGTAFDRPEDAAPLLAGLHARFPGRTFEARRNRTEAEMVRHYRRASCR